MSKERGAGTVEDVEEVPTGSGLEGPGFFRYERWWPIRVAFTKWRVSAPKTTGNLLNSGNHPLQPSWDIFRGYMYVHSQKWRAKFDSSPSFLDQCRDSKCLPNRGGRNLHREEMNLHPAGEYLEMYDRLVGREWDKNPERIVFLNKYDSLPLVHIIVNNSDGYHGRGHFDLFFPHELHFGNTNTVCYMNNEQFSGQHQQVRENSAGIARVCTHCATTLDRGDWDEYRLTQGTVYHIKSGPSSSWPIDGVYGYREYGQEITKEMSRQDRGGGIIVHLPPSNHVDRIFLPRGVVHELFGKGKQWTRMRIFPDGDLP